MLSTTQLASSGSFTQIYNQTLAVKIIKILSTERVGNLIKVARSQRIVTNPQFHDEGGFRRQGIIIIPMHKTLYSGQVCV